MRRLTSEVKAYIVQRLACFDPPGQIVEGVKEVFQIDITPQHVNSHNPRLVSGKDLAKKWVDLFEETREEFKADSEDISVSHKSARLRVIDRMVKRAEEMGNFVLVASLLEQAAKEMGDSYTNRHKLEHSSPDGSMSPAGRSLNDFYRDADVSAKPKP